MAFAVSDHEPSRTSPKQGGWFTAGKTPPEQIPVGLWAQFRRQSPGYAAGLLVLALYQYLQYLFDNLLDEAVDKAVAGNGEAAANGGFAGMGLDATQLGVVLVLIALVSFGARVVSRVAIFNGGRNAEYELRRALLHHLQRLGPAFYSRMSTGDIMSRVTNDLTQVRLLLGFGVLNFFGTTFGLISALAVTLERSVKLTLASLSTFPLLIVVVMVFSRQMFTRQRENQVSLGALSDRVQSSIAGVRVVRSFGLEEAEMQRFEISNQDYLDKSLRLARLRGVMWPIMGAIASFGSIVLLWYGGHLVLTDPSFDAGSFVAFLRALGRLTWPLISLGFLISVIQRGRASYLRVQALFDSKPDITDGDEPLPAGPVRLEVKDLSFSYPTKQVLSNVSFELMPGKSLAIVGRTGSGKTTLALLLARLQQTPRGAVFLSGVDVCDLPLESLRKTVGYAQQDPFLFSTTIGRNIGYVLAEPDSELGHRTVEAAAEEAQLSGEIAILPHGFDTVVGERGVQLSGGQKQRTSLARALVSEPAILVLDDPLSAVDGRTEAAILHAIDRQRARRGVILITHRVSAAQRCDEILVLDRGQVVARGSHAELMSQGGLYAVFAEEQRVESELKEIADKAPAAIGAAALPHEVTV
jgi:ATP-binding cassette subfamily B protein